MKALITQKVDELNDIRKKQLAEKEIQAEIKEESRKKERESFEREKKSFEREKKSFEREKKSFEREKKLMKKEFQLEREILEICYNNGYLPQKNKPKIEHDDTIDIEPED